MSKYLVIGASSGIGLATAQQLALEGHEVIGTYCNTSDYPTIAGVEMHKLDVTQPELNLGFLVDKIDGIVYCPGSINLKPFKRITPQEFQDDFNLQVLGAVKVIQGALTKLNSEASIVLFSTVAVQTGFTFHSQVAASKGAIEGLTKALSAELAPKVRVNCIAPSITDTPLASKLLSSEDKKAANAQRHPLKKIGEPSDLAHMTSFLLSEKAQWMTGQIIHLDGGMSSLRV